MTASPLVNKTLPHLLELSKDAYTILAGPSCPMCPQLLDFGNQLLVLERARSLAREGYTVIQTTHHPEQSYMYSDRILAIQNGRVLTEGPPKAVLTEETIHALYGVDVVSSSAGNGDYYKTPSGPYGWLSSLPAVQRYLGMLWLGELLYPEYTAHDLQEKVTEYYRLFCGCNLTAEMYQELMADSR